MECRWDFVDYIMNSSKDVLQFYDSMHLEYPKLCNIGSSRLGLSKSCIEIAMNRIYSDRFFYPKISLGHRIWLTAKRIDPLIAEWKQRPWWKKLYQSIIFPSTTIWEYDIWRTLRN